MTNPPVQFQGGIDLGQPRELLNTFQTDEIGRQVITVTTDIPKKLSLWGYDLDQYSLDTVKMYYNGAQAASFGL